ncbi:MAG TPA: hypothetical protein VKT27_08760 [Candidatus Binataceae bacterium]|nr:hypothetical protein [Candidatus Binataceae bacterium]
MKRMSVLRGGAMLAAAALGLAMGAASAGAAGRSGEPGELARRQVPAMAPPALATREMSTEVSGVFVANQGPAAAGHEMHFQNRVSGNIYTVVSGQGGAFSLRLPPGVYDLRGQHGAIIADGVVVGRSPVNLGQVHPPAPYSIWRWFQRQHVAEAIVQSPAPAAAYVPAAGAMPQAIAVTPIQSPPVMGGGSGGQALPPAEVMPPQVQEQTALPADAEVPPAGTPLTTAPANGAIKPPPPIAPMRGTGGY